ncbi:MAG: PAS domain S-box protein, partial [Methanomicrobiales archaeon]|nr:PAS domain S-box protein [Methanomicrobiales archaeon]
MALDIRTITFILFLLSALLAFMFLIYWKTQKTYNGFSHWAFAMVVMALAYCAIMLRGTIPDLISVLLTNLFITASVLMLADGTSRFFRGRPLPSVVYGTLVPFVILIFWLTTGYDSIVARAIASAVMIVPPLLFVGYMALRSADGRNHYITWSFGAALTGFAILYAARCLYWVMFPPENIFSGDEPNTLFFILAIIMELASAGFFLLLNMVRTQTEAAASEERYQLLAESLPDYIIVHNGRTILYANPTTAQITGRDPDSIRTMQLRSFLAPKGPDDADTIIRELCSTAAPARPHEIVITTQDGRNRTCLVKNVPVRYRGRRVTLSVLTDITEAKQVQEALRTTNSKLSLLSGITRHDIKNQLTALSAFLALGTEPDTKPADAEEYLGNCHKIMAVIERQIDFTRDYESLGMSSPEWQDPVSLLKIAAAALAPGRVRVETGYCNVELFCDPLLEKVFYNLLDNSLRYG